MPFKTKGADKNPVTAFNGGNNGNGHSGGIDADFLEGLLGDSNAPSIAREFVHPGDEPQELLMRTVFKDEEQVNAAAEYLSMCNRYNYKNGLNRLMYKMAGNCSIDGLRIKELMMALTQRVVPELYNKRGHNYSKDDSHDNGNGKGP